MQSNTDAIMSTYNYYLSDEQQSFPLCKTPDDLDNILTHGENSLDGLIILNCFWRHSDPLKCLSKLEDCLKPEASAVFFEPLMSPISYLWAKLKHPNQVDIKTSPYQQNQNSSASNIAFSSMIFDRIENRIEFMNRHPKLTFASRERLGLFMGCRWLPSNWTPSLFKLDKLLMPFLGNFSSFHMKVIITKKS